MDIGQSCKLLMIKMVKEHAVEEKDFSLAVNIVFLPLGGACVPPISCFRWQCKFSQ